MIKKTAFALLAAMALSSAMNTRAQEQNTAKPEYKTSPEHDTYMLAAPGGKLVVLPKEELAKYELETTDLGGNTYMLAGPGGNVTVAVGEDAVLLVDSEYAPLHDKVVAAVAKVTPKPIRTVVITHSHEDHADGIANFVKAGAVVIGHANARKRLQAGSPEDKLTGFKTEPVTGAALPTMTFTDSATPILKGRRLQAGHLANAHSDSDTYVYLADANVLCTGDLVILTRYPFIDLPGGGSVQGLIAAVDTLLALANDTTRIVPGHGPAIDKAALRQYRMRVATARDRVQELIAAGKSEDEAVAARPLADLDATVGATEYNSASFVRRIYRSLKS